MDDFVLFILGASAHLFLGLYFFHLFNGHRLLPFFFLGEISVPLALKAEFFALGEVDFADLISCISNFFMIFFIFLFFLSDDSKDIFIEYVLKDVFLLDRCRFTAIQIFIHSSAALEWRIPQQKTLS